MPRHKKVTKRRRAWPGVLLVLLTLSVAGLAWGQDAWDLGGERSPGTAAEQAAGGGSTSPSADGPDDPGSTDTPQQGGAEQDGTGQDGAEQDGAEQDDTGQEAGPASLALSAPETTEILAVTPLEGTVSGIPAGTALVVEHQQPDGSWAAFPLPTVVDEDGSFLTNVELGRPGPNVLRVRDEGTGLASEPVTITVG